MVNFRAKMHHIGGIRERLFEVSTGSKYELKAYFMNQKTMKTNEGLMKKDSEVMKIPQSSKQAEED